MNCGMQSALADGSGFIPMDHFDDDRIRGATRGRPDPVRTRPFTYVCCGVVY